MIKTILVPVTGNGGDKSALDTAFLIGRLFEAHIECLHIRPTAEQMIMGVASTGLASGIDAEIVSQAFDALKAADQSRAESVRDVVQSFCRERPIVFATTPPRPRGVSFALHKIKGDEIEQTIQAGRYHDLIVLGRPHADAVSVGNLGAVLIGCGRPVILAPSPATENLAPTVAIAWKETPEAARAVTASMPLLAKADRIVVLTASEDGVKTDATLESAERLAGQLRWHDLSVEARHVAPGTRSLANAMTDTAREAGADLLIMGAYGHSRVRELILGGVTREILKACPIPVLLFH